MQKQLATFSLFLDSSKYSVIVQFVKHGTLKKFKNKFMKPSENG